MQTGRLVRVSVAVETGIVGLLLYLGMFLAVFLALMRLPSFERRFTPGAKLPDVGKLHPGALKYYDETKIGVPASAR